MGHFLGLIGVRTRWDLALLKAKTSDSAVSAPFTLFPPKDDAGLLVDIHGEA